jgi:hypothetical protein
MERPPKMTSMYRRPDEDKEDDRMCRRPDRMGARPEDGQGCAGGRAAGMIGCAGGRESDDQKMVRDDRMCRRPGEGKERNEDELGMG